MKSTTYEYQDPRGFLGDPFQVAALSISQIRALVKLAAEKLIEDADVMARNAEMERQLYFTHEADATIWAASPQAQKINTVLERLNDAHKQLGTLELAAEFNPKKTPSP